MCYTTPCYSTKMYGVTGISLYFQLLSTLFIYMLHFKVKVKYIRAIDIIKDSFRDEHTHENINNAKNYVTL